MKGKVLTSTLLFADDCHTKTFKKYSSSTTLRMNSNSYQVLMYFVFFLFAALISSCTQQIPNNNDIYIYIMTQKNDVSVSRLELYINIRPGYTLVILLMKQSIHQLILGKLPSIYGIYILFLIIMIVTVSFLYISQLFFAAFLPSNISSFFSQTPRTTKVFVRPNMVTWNSVVGAYAEETRFLFFFQMGGGGKYRLNDIRYITFAKTKGPQRTVTWCKVPDFLNISWKMSGLFDITCG